MDITNKLEMFRQAIQAEAEAEANEISAEMRARKAASGRTRDKLATKEALNKIRTELARSEADFKREMSRCDYELKKSVLIHRNELITEFFTETEAKLRDFVLSEQYPDYLKRSLEKIRAAIALDSATLVYARPCDVDAVRALTSCEVTADSTIRLGGLRAMCRNKNVLCDVTLDMALEDEKKRFNEKTELKL